MKYSTKEGIAEAIKTLKGFDELRNLRREAYRSRKEQLNGFVVFGRWWLDSCGNCMGLDQPIQGLDPVLTKDEFFEATGQDMLFGSRSGISIPQNGEVCAVCGNWWSTVNIHDCYRDRHQVYHARCYKIKRSTDVQEQFQTAFKLAGAWPATFEPIENEYAPGATLYYTNWFIVTTPLAQFKVGWRKRVIHLEVLDPEIDIASLFPDEKTTKWYDGIHCWGLLTLSEYVSEISSQLLERKRDRLWPKRVERRERWVREAEERLRKREEAVRAADQGGSD